MTEKGRWGTLGGWQNFVFAQSWLQRCSLNKNPLTCTFKPSAFRQGVGVSLKKKKKKFLRPTKQNSLYQLAWP